MATRRPRIGDGRGRVAVCEEDDWSIFERMWSAGEFPNVVTFNKVGDGTQEIFETMRTVDVGLNVVAFNKVGDGMQEIARR